MACSIPPTYTSTGMPGQGDGVTVCVSVRVIGDDIRSLSREFDFDSHEWSCSHTLALTCTSGAVLTNPQRAAGHTQPLYCSRPSTEDSTMTNRRRCPSCPHSDVRARHTSDTSLSPMTLHWPMALLALAAQSRSSAARSSSSPDPGQSEGRMLRNVACVRACHKSSTAQCVRACHNRGHTHPHTHPISHLPTARLADKRTSGSATGRLVHATGTSPHAPHFTIGIGVPQYRCRETSQSRILYVVWARPRPEDSAAWIMADRAAEREAPVKVPEATRDAWRDEESEKVVLASSHTRAHTHTRTHTHTHTYTRTHTHTRSPLDLYVPTHTPQSAPIPESQCARAIHVPAQRARPVRRARARPSPPPCPRPQARNQQRTPAVLRV